MQVFYAKRQISLTHWHTFVWNRMKEKDNLETICAYFWPLFWSRLTSHRGFLQRAPHVASLSPPTPYLSLSAELHSEPFCSISPSILEPITPGNSSSASAEYCLLLPSRLRSRATGAGRCWILNPALLQTVNVNISCWCVCVGYLTVMLFLWTRSSLWRRSWFYWPVRG